MIKELLVLDNEVYNLEKNASSILAELDKEEKRIKQKKEEIKSQLKYEMEAKGIKSIKDEVNGINITYIEETQKETFDSKAFRKDNPDLYDNYVKFSDVKASVRISIK